MTCPSSVSASDRNVTDVALCIEIRSFPDCLFSYIQNREHKNSSFLGCLSSKALPFSPRRLFLLDVCPRIQCASLLILVTSNFIVFWGLRFLYEYRSDALLV